MTEKSLMVLCIHALDHVSRLKDLQEILYIALEQDQEPLEKRCSRIELLIDFYRPATDLCINELEFALEATRKLIGATLEDD